MIPDLSTKCGIGSTIQWDPMVKFDSGSWIPLVPSVIFGSGSWILWNWWWCKEIVDPSGSQAYIRRFNYVISRENSTKQYDSAFWIYISMKNDVNLLKSVKDT